MYRIIFIQNMSMENFYDLDTPTNNWLLCRC